MHTVTRSNSRLLAVFVAAAFALTFTHTAAADQPPPPESIEAHCTLEEQCPTGTECFTSGGQNVRNTDCYRTATERGLLRRCNRGVSNATHVFCSPGATGSWRPPGALRQRLGCEVVAAGNARTNAGFVVVLFGYFVLRLLASRRRYANTGDAAQAVAIRLVLFRSRNSLERSSWRFGTGAERNARTARHAEHSRC